MVDLPTDFPAERGFFATGFFTDAFLAGALFATVFFAGAFFAGAAFLAAGFFTAAFLAAGFLAVCFLAMVFVWIQVVCDEKSAKGNADNASGGRPVGLRPCGGERRKTASTLRRATVSEQARVSTVIAEEGAAKRMGTSDAEVSDAKTYHGGKETEEK